MPKYYYMGIWFVIKRKKSKGWDKYSYTITSSIIEGNNGKNQKFLWTAKRSALATPRINERIFEVLKHFCNSNNALRSENTMMQIIK